MQGSQGGAEENARASHEIVPFGGPHRWPEAKHGTARSLPFSTSPWNSGRNIGPKPPLKPKPVWAIRQPLRNAGHARDLALFDCGIDAKPRGCDLVRLRVSDVAPGGSLRQRATVIQQKTGRPVPFEITDATRDALAGWLAIRGRRDDDWLFPSRSRPGDHISTRQYARLVAQWVGMIGLEQRAYELESTVHCQSFTNR